MSQSNNLLKLGIVHKETDKFIGFISTGIKEQLPEPNREIAYGISKDYRNKGYTTKVAKGLINFLFEKTNLELLNTIALTENISSNRVIQRSGFHFVGDIEIENQNYHHYTRNKSEWKRNK